MDIINFIKQNDYAKILLIVVGIYLFLKFFKKENFKPWLYESLENTEPVQQPVVQQPVEGTLASTDVPIPQKEQEQIEKVVQGTDTAKVSDLLPKYEEATEFSKQNPVSDLLKEQNYLISSFHNGINSVVQSNKISYQDIRSAPPIPKKIVSPWCNSSYESFASGRRFLEIGK